MITRLIVHPAPHVRTHLLSDLAVLTAWQRLPVPLIPEHRGIALVLDAVVGDSRTDDTTLPQALDAEGISCEVSPGRDAPPVPVSAGSGIPAAPVELLPFLDAVVLALDGIRLGATSGVAAWALHCARA